MKDHTKDTKACKDIQGLCPWSSWCEDDACNDANNEEESTLSTALAVVTNSQMMVNVLDVTPVGGGTTIAVPALIVFQKKVSNGAATSAVIKDALL